MMIEIASVWLALCLALCVYAWFGVRCLWALPLLGALAAYAVYVPTGQPRFTAPPPGRYAVLGADIDVGKAIRVLLKGDGPAVYYTLPYSDSKASELQNALDTAAQGGGTASMVEGESGGETYDGPPPVTADENKTPETPEYSF